MVCHFFCFLALFTFGFSGTTCFFFHFDIFALSLVVFSAWQFAQNACIFDIVCSPPMEIGFLWSNCAFLKVTFTCLPLWFLEQSLPTHNSCCLSSILTFQSFVMYRDCFTSFFLGFRFIGFFI